MTAPTFNPAPPLADRLIDHLADPSLSFADIASRAGCSLEALTAWLTRPDNQDRLIAFGTAASLRARALAAILLPDAVNAIGSMLHAYNAAEAERRGSPRAPTSPSAPHAQPTTPTTPPAQHAAPAAPLTPATPSRAPGPAHTITNVITHAAGVPRPDLESRRISARRAAHLLLRIARFHFDPARPAASRAAAALRRTAIYQSDGFPPSARSIPQTPAPAPTPVPSPTRQPTPPQPASALHTITTRPTPAPPPPPAPPSIRLSPAHSRAATDNGPDSFHPAHPPILRAATRATSREVIASPPSRITPFSEARQTNTEDQSDPAQVALEADLTPITSITSITPLTPAAPLLTPLTPLATIGPAP